MNIGSLFSGAGALDIAVEEVFGGQVVWHSEINPAACKVLAHNNPDVPNIGDITCINWDVWPEIHPEVLVPVDILCGGWPCQPFSLAGKRKGIHDDRALWPYVNRAIRTLRPRIVVLENVPAVFSAGEFDRVANGLAEAGYDFAWTCLRASDIGAPHRRERLFIVAYTDHPGRGEQRRPVAAPQELAAAEYPCGDVELDLAGPLRAQGKAGVTGKPPTPGPASLLPTPAAADGRRGQDFARANRAGSGGDDLVTIAVKASRDKKWGKYAEAIARWETVTRPAPEPTEPNRNGNQRLAASFSEWMMGWPSQWVTDPAIGISRNDQLKIVGNGVCPQQAAAALRYLLEVTA
jgi:DNA (cytosine-5)-methyltransferase 1